MNLNSVWPFHLKIFKEIQIFLETNKNQGTSYHKIMCGTTIRQERDIKDSHNGKKKSNDHYLQMA